jgi:hypothetical protein
MKTMECRLAQQEVDQLELRAVLSNQTLAHLASCPACSEFREQRARLRELVGSLSPVTAPADFDLRLRARIAAQRQRATPRTFFTSFVLSTPAMAAAGLVVIMAVSAVWFLQHRADRAPEVASRQSSQPSGGNSKAIGASSATTKENVETGLSEDRSTGATIQSAGEPVQLVSNRRSSPPFIETARPTQAGMTSRDLGLGPAHSIKRGEPNAGEVSVTAPLRPMVLSLQDDNGAIRTISLPPVSFGSQRGLESRVVPVIPANGRIW